MAVLQFIIAMILFCPFIIFLLVYAVATQFMKLSKYRAFTVAADSTTPLLFIAVPLFFKAITTLSMGLWLILGAICIAIIMTVIEWRSVKEIRIKPLLVKIWRALFAVLSLIYIVLIIIGLMFSVGSYIFS